tara:strand:+ start:362 stop:607 length:246 start_codon:yes stop_codon:yes gene_type:complete
MTDVIVKSLNLSDLTPEEQDFYKEEKVRNLAEAEELANAREKKENDKASGNQKLLDLGLSQDEATALTGYTPPVEDEETSE